MSQTTNAAGVRLIKSFEKLVLHAYRDGGGVPTIGWGRTRGVKIGQVINEAQAEAFFQADLAVAEKAVNALKLHLTDNQFSALVSFAFNAGSLNLRKLMRLGLPAVPDRLPLFIYDNHRAVKGLLRRRLAEKKLFETL